ncbi:MAG: SDR family NAD(P)-dependent oxidoreductase [Fluviicoccus sp.]|uniref:peroxisomal multifunctional enzyme type 2 n=1 Tax=Fluviicoccus sp. TaxID=2003552 RepID=UPI0027281F1E|nr:peroxisomal multifunctional enzyme type 2 [Fluviicoccus sp.]MDO8329571.1 SDR family NAD(P)-dependent oxidoreductase [Fluviicoccus sp.]
MSQELRFDGRVAIVTGAGNGLGRQHALLLASRGAKVVVNDLGGGRHGDGKSSAAADAVVEEIRAAGGEAVANYDSVENGTAIVQTALDAFGTVDIVINNAGILRDVSFQKMTQDDWDLVYRVHLKGSMSVSHAAWPIMREKGYGRIIMTTSAAGIYGNFGQANYCAAKLGILGLAHCLAEEGRSKNILVNTIAPLAASRLTETILPPEMLALLKPEYVSPLVAWLCHESCEDTKGLFEVGAGYIGKLRWERTQGHSFNTSRAMTVDEIAGKWAKISDFTDSEHPSTTNESFGTILANLNKKSLGGNEFIDLDAASKDEIVTSNAYDERDLALYALGVGSAANPLDATELPYVYELGDGFQALPTYGVMPALNAYLNLAKDGKSLQGLNYGLDRVLHGEQYTELLRPLPPHAKLTHTFRFKNAYDKAPHAVVVMAVDTVDETGEKLAYNEISTFVRGAGGWGGDRGPSGDVNVPPAREPDAVIEEKTADNQTLLYRLSGDWNPLHADPAFAKAFGFEKPILHGLCTFGYVGRHVIKAFCGNDGRRFKSIKVRFADSVFPGETLITRMWKESDIRIIVETSVKERNSVVIRNAAVELYAEIPKAKTKPTVAATSAPAAVSSGQPDKLLPEDVFSVLAAHVAAHPELVDKVKTVFQFNLKNPDSAWLLDLKNGQGVCKAGVAEKADVTLDMDAEHISTVVSSSLADVQKLFFNGKLKIGGNVMASNKLIVLQDIKPQAYEEARAKRVAGGGGAAATASAPAAAPVVDANAPLEPSDVFAAISDYLSGHPELVEKAKTVFQFNLKNPDSQWFLDLKNGAGACGSGAADKADVTLEIDAELMPAIVTSSLADVQKLFFSGKLKVTGNIMASNKLIALQAIDPKAYEAAKLKRLSSGAASPAATAVTAAKQSQAPAIMAALAKKLADKPATGCLLIKITDVGNWLIDGASVGSVADTVPAETTITLSDSDLLQLAQGKADLRDLFQHGQVRVDGDVALVKQLTVLGGLV